MTHPKGSFTDPKLVFYSPKPKHTTVSPTVYILVILCYLGYMLLDKYICSSNNRKVRPDCLRGRPDKVHRNEQGLIS